VRAYCAALTDSTGADAGTKGAGGAVNPGKRKGQTAAEADPGKNRSQKH